MTNIIRHYLTDRLLLTEVGVLQVSCGVPQGSVLGPLLWNMSYDGVLRLQLNDNVKLIAFADDLAVVSWARTMDGLKDQTNAALNVIHKWFSKSGLKLATHKTEAVLLIGGRRVTDQVVFRLGVDNVVPKDSLRYLGVRLDTRMSFKAHIIKAVNKGDTTAATVSRLMPNLGGPRSGKRRIISSAVMSKVLYGAPIWSKALSTKSYLSTVEGLERRVGLRIIGAYRTVSLQ